jgi:hypothetical protein
MTFKKLGNNRGSILLSLIITLPFLILITATYLSLSVDSLNIARGDQFQTHSQFTADAGIDYAIQQINQNSTWSGTGTWQDLMNSNNVLTQYNISIADVGDNKIITSTGRTRWPAASATPRSEVTINVQLRSVSSGSYSIVTGVGGLIMDNSSQILGGDVFINGGLTMSNTSQIGLSFSPSSVYVAHQNCPVPATSSYPSLCANGENGQPITINDSARIYGDVRANNQTDDSGMEDDGLLVPQCTNPTAATPGVNCVTPQPLPKHDRAAQVAAANANTAGVANVSGSSASCSLGSKTFPADTKITGDLVIEGSCAVLIEGDIWVTGNLKVRNSGTIIVSDGLNSTRPNIMVDGSSGAEIGNSGLLDVNAAGTGFQLITYWSASSCSPDCPNVTGLDLYNSRNVVTISLTQSSAGSDSIFYSKWSRVEVQNTGSIGALVGQTVHLKNSGAITFGTSAGTGTSFWVIDGYRRTF